jgi:vacuolar-type H+-ATPase subunit B/Vma2
MMTLIEACRNIVETKGACLLAPAEKGSKYHDVLPMYHDTGSESGEWVLVDLQSANAFVQVYDALNEVNQNKLLLMSVTKAMDVVWKLVNGFTAMKGGK